jgi:predicted phage terminase large subunit-like protein
MPFGSMTGSRGDRVLLDDPLSVDSANSDADLEAARLTFTEALPTRVNNEASAIVVIMQRLNEKDTSGIILNEDLGYTHLMLPMRFEAERRCTTFLGFTDPRKVEGELLFPERFSEVTVKALEKQMGSYATAGQLQQRPAPRGGGLYKRHWFNVVQAVPLGTKMIRGWDFAATEGAGDYTAGVKLGRTKEGRFIIVNATRAQLSPAGVDRLIKATASQDGYTCAQSFPQDPGAAGKAQATYQVGQLAGYIVASSTESGSKWIRALPMAAQAEAGNVDILEGDWNTEYLDELCEFDHGKYDDQVDATSRAFNELVNNTTLSTWAKLGK